MTKFKCLTTKLTMLRNRVENLQRLGRDAISGAPHSAAVKTFLAQKSQFDNFCRDNERTVEEIIMLENKPQTFSEEDFNKDVTNFDGILAEMRMWYMELQPPVASSGVGYTEISRKENVPARLPSIPLPQFSGSVSEWTSFFSLFNSLVGNNNSVTNVERLQYLRLSLHGEALDLIKGLEVTNENYLAALRLLKDRYENKRKIAETHADKLINFPTITNTSAKHLRSLIATYRENTEALCSLGVMPRNMEDTCDGLFLFLILNRKIDIETRCQFEHTLNSSKDIPSPDTLISFLEKECLALEASESNRVVPGRKAEGRVVAAVSVNTAKKCLGCEKRIEHRLFQCSVFLKLAAEKRKEFVQERRLCFNCLDGHRASMCPSTRRCNICSGKHHTVLHLDRVYSNKAVVHSNEHSVDVEFTTDEGGNSETAIEESEDAINTNLATASLTTSLAKPGLGVVLSTLIVGIQNSNGNYEPVRAMLDTGSQASYLTVNCARRLNLKWDKADSKIFGIAHQGVSVRGSVSLHMRHHNGGRHLLSTRAFLLEKITGNLPVSRLDASVRSQLGNLTLADPYFDIPAPVECLLGADIFAKCIADGRLLLGQDKPVVFNTIFGWVLLGGSSGVLPSVETQTLHSYHTFVEEPLDVVLWSFWETEEPTIIKVLDPLSFKCEEHFKQTHSRLSDGRYMVRLPFKESNLKLGDSLQVAESRFFALEKRLSRCDELYVLYHRFMKEYRESQHMEIFERGDMLNSQDYYYMPHHGVIKPSSSTTKLRVVFDASACTTSNSRCSLNDLLLKGPKLQHDIRDIILRFRVHAVVFMADIRQMFRCVWLHPEDRRFHLILWRDSPSEQLKTYCLNTVTFGVTSSPFLAMRSLLQLANDAGEEFRGAARVLREDVFVDDIVTGTATLEEALSLQSQLNNLLASAGFELRKWASNQRELLESIPEQSREIPLPFSAPDIPTFGVLGIGWQSTADSLVYLVGLPEVSPTKRGILSCVARIYDPMGFLTPVTLWLKVFLQQLWAQGLGWDAAIPEDLNNKWATFSSGLSQLSEVKIPRYLQSSRGVLHGFCDASEVGYAAVVYYHPVCSKPVILIAKSRVAPLKRISVPRLELCGAHLLAKLIKFCIDTLGSLLRITSVFAWTDSTTVLTWIGCSPHTLKTFVANRIAEIQSWLSPYVWRHVPSGENPVDAASRGMHPGHFVGHEVWFSGPPFLCLTLQEWPKPLVINSELERIPERKTNPINLLIVRTREVPELPYVTRISSWPRLVRVTAYVLRFLNNYFHVNAGRKGPLTVSELRIAEMAVVRMVQRHCFGEDMAALEGGMICSTRLQRLTPFLDAAGLLRVGGRLRNAEVWYSVKHPLVLPKNHHITNLIIDHFHTIYLHAGPRLLQSLISRQFWILSCRSAIRYRLHRRAGRC